MRRITVWLTATMAVLALVFAYELNQSGTRDAQERVGPPQVTACQAATPCPTPTLTPTSPTGSDGSTSTAQPNTGGDTSAHSPRPGENK